MGLRERDAEGASLELRDREVATIDRECMREGSLCECADGLFGIELLDSVGRGGVHIGARCGERFDVRVGQFCCEVVRDAGGGEVEAVRLRSHPQRARRCEQCSDRDVAVFRPEERKLFAIEEKDAAAAGAQDEVAVGEGGECRDVAQRWIGGQQLFGCGAGVVEEEDAGP